MSRKKWSILIGGFSFVIFFVLQLIGFMVILAVQVELKNIISYFILSALLGGTLAVLFYFNLWIFLWFLSIGTIIGFMNMFRMFIDGMGGWADLVGFFSLITWIVIGFIAGLAFQFISNLYRKYKK